MILRDDEIKNRILAVAEERFIKNGVDGTDMTEIAENAGCARSTLYRYFPDKTALLFQIIRKYNEITSDYMVIPEGTRFGTGYDAVAWQINRFIDGLFSNPEYVSIARNFDIMFSENYPDTIQVLDYVESVSKSEGGRYLRDSIIRGYEDESIKRICEPWLLVHTLVQTCLATTQRILPREKMFIREYGLGQEMIRTATRILLEGIKA